jgi:hypothetical protein
VLKSSLLTVCLLAAAVCAANTARADDPKPSPEKAASTVNHGCPTDSGSRIPVRPHECSAIGRTYSRDDIALTGKTSAGGALRMLDTTGTVH